MKNDLIDFISIFVPEKVILNDNRAEIWFLGKLVSSQNLEDIFSVSYFQKHDHTGGQVLNVIAGGEEISYFKEQVGFSHFVQAVIKKADIPSHLADDMIAKKILNKIFNGKKQVNFHS